MNIIRKIVIGKEYTKDAMSYSVGQEVYRRQYVIDSIVKEDDHVVIYIKQNGVIKKWKEINSHIPHIIEYSLDFS